eukprot:c20771_g1_i10.p1 GENE.c20771_g1_i10~~c20771_g1_i10.p1  ORF type:complete len:335 (+),score=65.53 c20771_g1_i10:54-1007(+)
MGEAQLKALRQAMDTVDLTHAQVQSNCDAALASIRSLFDALRSVLGAREAELVTRVQQLRKQKSFALNDQRICLAALQSRTQAAMEAATVLAAQAIPIGGGGRRPEGVDMQSGRSMSEREREAVRVICIGSHVRAAMLQQQQRVDSSVEDGNVGFEVDFDGGEGALMTRLSELLSKAAHVTGSAADERLINDNRGGLVDSSVGAGVDGVVVFDAAIFGDEVSDDDDDDATASQASPSVSQTEVRGEKSLVSRNRRWLLSLLLPSRKQGHPIPNNQVMDLQQLTKIATSLSQAERKIRIVRPHSVSFGIQRPTVWLIL